MTHKTKAVLCFIGAWASVMLMGLGLTLSMMAPLPWMFLAQLASILTFVAIFGILLCLGCVMWFLAP